VDEGDEKGEETGTLNLTFSSYLLTYLFSLFVLSCFGLVWFFGSLNSGPCSCQAHALPLEPCDPHLTSPPLALFVLLILQMVSLIYAQDGLDSHPPIYASSRDDRHITTIPSFYWLRLGRGGGVSKFFPRLALNHYPPDLCFPYSKDYRCESPHLAFYPSLTGQ
jgi:hypothetical protein